ncbi:Hypothetical protein GL50581_2756 [Giardia duodenalis ATCC 50581]|uniref:Uncharacterized protein n=1 Tax=Giardia intestinalis (strain ATCC 50581 / GS clone H7) TaxID=598745 RepID=C6LVF0_GIAIB|nr:Hypothetical protein GL50581_2756 [Giardia intestinalis ATCC 50581]
MKLNNDLLRQKDQCIDDHERISSGLALDRPNPGPQCMASGLNFDSGEGDKFSLFRARATTKLDLPVFQTDLSPIYHKSDAKLKPKHVSSILPLQNLENLGSARRVSSVTKPPGSEIYPLTNKQKANQTNVSEGGRPIYFAKKASRLKPAVAKRTVYSANNAHRRSSDSAVQTPSLPCVTLLSDSLTFSANTVPHAVENTVGSSSHVGISLGHSLGTEFRDPHEIRKHGTLAARSSEKEANIAKKEQLEVELLTQKIQFNNQQPTHAPGKKLNDPIKVPASASRAYGSRAPMRTRTISASAYIRDSTAKMNSAGVEVRNARSVSAGINNSFNPPRMYASQRRDETQGSLLRISVQNMDVTGPHLVEVTQPSRQATGQKHRPRSADSVLHARRGIMTMSALVTPSRDPNGFKELSQRLTKSSCIDINSTVNLALSVRGEDAGNVNLARKRPQSAIAGNAKEYLLAGSYKLPFNKQHAKAKLGPRKVEPIIKPIDRIQEVIGFNPSGYMYEKGRIEREKQEFLRQCNGAVRQYPASATLYPRKPQRLSWHGITNVRQGGTLEEVVRLEAHSPDAEPREGDALRDEGDQMNVISFGNRGNRAGDQITQTPVRKHQGPASARTAILESPEKRPSNAKIVQQYIASLSGAQKPRPISAAVGAAGVDSLPARVFITREPLPLRRTCHKHQVSMFYDPNATTEAYDRTVRLRSRPSSASKAPSTKY